MQRREGDPESPPGAEPMLIVGADESFVSAVDAGLDRAVERAVPRTVAVGDATEAVVLLDGADGTAESSAGSAAKTRSEETAGPSPSETTSADASRSDSTQSGATPSGSTSSGTASPGVEDGASAVACVVGYHHPGQTDALATYERVREVDPAVPFVLVDPTADPDLGTRALAAGVDEYVPVGSSGDGAVDAADVVVSRYPRLAANGGAGQAAAAAVDESTPQADQEGLPLRSLLADLSVMIYRCRNAPGWPMEYVSEGVEGLTGHEPAALLRDEVTYGEDVVHPEDRELVWETVQSALADGEPYRLDYRILTADGEVRWVWEQGRATGPGVGDGQADGDVGDRDGPGDAGGVFLEGFITDVTERRRVRDELAERNERLDEFASIVSHDLRNPLNVAAGRLELARQEVDSEHLAAAATALDRMEALVDDLLTLARQGDDIEGTEPVALGGLAREAWHSVETREASLEVAIERRVLADQSRLAQLFENLFRNAVEHAGEDVTVTVGETADGEGFFVADDGPGIPPSERERVFQGGYSTSHDGTGFGLRIVSDVASGHGWSVALEESADGGARFAIRGVEWA